MNNKNHSTNRNTKPKSLSKTILVVIGIILVLSAAILYTKGGSDNTESTASGGNDIVIFKNEIPAAAKFYPTKVGKTNMEVLAVKASDGSIRTAFNTCQVCNGSPKAYYKQQGDVLVCQNCGNKFKLDMIEQQRGGCNPIPIMKEDKVDDGTNITISREFIEQNKGLFTSNWKTK